MQAGQWKQPSALAGANRLTGDTFPMHGAASRTMQNELGCFSNTATILSNHKLLELRHACTYQNKFVLPLIR